MQIHFSIFFTSCLISCSRLATCSCSTEHALLLPDLLLHHDLFCCRYDDPSHRVHSEAAELLRVVILPDGDDLVREEEEDLGRPKGGEEPLEGVAPVEPGEEGAGWGCGRGGP